MKFHHLQTKFAKVMFSQVFICPKWGVSASRRWVCIQGRVSVSRAGGLHPGRPDPTPHPHQILWDTVNEHGVRILLECILFSLISVAAQFEH